MGIFSTLGGLAGLAFGPIGATVGTALGGHLDASQARKQKKSDALFKFSDMRRAAERAGFHPLEVLRATGGGGFGDYGSPFNVQTSVPLGAIMGEEVDKKKETDEKEVAKELSDEQKRLRDERNTIVRPASGGTKSVASEQRKRADKAAEIIYDRIGNERTPGLAIGVLGDLHTTADASDAEFAEQRYGDIAQEIFGAATLATDLGNKVGGMWADSPFGVFYVNRAIDRILRRDEGKLQDAFSRPRRPAHMSQQDWERVKSRTPIVRRPYRSPIKNQSRN